MSRQLKKAKKGYIGVSKIEALYVVEMNLFEKHFFIEEDTIFSKYYIKNIETENENIGRDMKTFLVPPYLHLSACPAYPSSVVHLSRIRL